MLERSLEYLMMLALMFTLLYLTHQFVGEFGDVFENMREINRHLDMIQ